MTPLEILRRYQGTIRLVDDCVLEQLCLADEPITATSFIAHCVSMKIASQATIHKSLSNLTYLGLIRSVKNRADLDNRKRWIAPTMLGIKRIKEFV